MADFSICYFGNYKSAYPRVRVFIDGLRQNNVEVIECKSDKPGILSRLADLALKYWKIGRRADVILVSEAGQNYVFLAKILGILTKNPVIFDAFISLYHVSTSEGETGPDSLKGRYLFYLDKFTLRAAELVFLDTKEHIDYFSKTFGIEESKMRPIAVGSDDSIFYPREGRKRDDIFRVFNVASFFPLHGIEYIVRAAKILEKEKYIEFRIFGNGPSFNKIKEMKENMGVKNLTLEGEIAIHELPQIMADSDICLGQFGGTVLSDMVIPIKVWDGFAMGKPVLTAETASIRSMLKDRVNVFLCKSKDPESLASAILTLKADKSLREELGKNARNFFIENASVKILGLKLKNEIAVFLKRRRKER